jgi:hypothetical protein
VGLAAQSWLLIFRARQQTGTAAILQAITFTTNVNRRRVVQ